MIRSPAPSRPAPYVDYLRLDSLLELQHCRSACPGEMAFIIVHQVYELWFKLVIDDLRSACEHLRAGDARRGLPRLERVVRVEDLLITQLGILEHMDTTEFLRLRSVLGHASGYQSGQFRCIESLSGLRAGPTADVGGELWSAFCTCMTRCGRPMPGGRNRDAGERRARSLRAIYVEGRAAPNDAWLRMLAESLLDHDELLALWRCRHHLLAARHIGTRPGTAATTGLGYLATTIQQRCFPELWALRDSLGGHDDAR